MALRKLTASVEMAAGPAVLVGSLAEVETEEVAERVDTTVGVESGSVVEGGTEAEEGNQAEAGKGRAGMEGKELAGMACQCSKSLSLF